MKTVIELEKVMCRPTDSLTRDIKNIDGDIMVLGAGGKMGPTLCKLAINAIRSAGLSKKVYAVSRFSDLDAAKDLEEHGIAVIKADLLDDHTLASLPDANNIIYMAGRKFGTSEDQSLTWAMNTYLPGRVADRFRNSRIVVFSTGNVYPFVPVDSGGCREDDPVGPIGIYANSCLGRENIFIYFSRQNGTPVLLFRLNYAIDMRYGVLLEIANAVKSGKPIDVTTGYFNAVWQGYANEAAIRSLLHCENPPAVLNVTGPETISARETAMKFASIFKTAAIFTGKEKDAALLSNASRCMDLFGKPGILLDEMISMTAEWVLNNGETLGKPTHFQERDGRY
ncbi:MAG: NAD-dependent epimerase/dehydratase family protein [Clostridia bacterium]